MEEEKGLREQLRRALFEAASADRDGQEAFDAMVDAACAVVERVAKERDEARGAAHKAADERDKAHYVAYVEVLEYAAQRLSDDVNIAGQLINDINAILDAAGVSGAQHDGKTKLVDRIAMLVEERGGLRRRHMSIEDCGQDGVCKFSPGCNRHWEERNRELVRQRDEAWAFLRRTAKAGGSIISSAAMTPTQIAIARAADRMLVTPDGYGFVYVAGVRAPQESDAALAEVALPLSDPLAFSAAPGSFVFDEDDEEEEEEEEDDGEWANRICRERDEAKQRITELQARAEAAEKQRDELQARMTEMVEGQLHRRVAAFYAEIVGKPFAGGPPRVPEEGELLAKVRLVVEECMELVYAAGYDHEDDELKRNRGFAPDLVQIADACADLMYVVQGLALACGIHLPPVIDEVHRSNMAKVGGQLDAAGKFRKPPGWTPPDIARVLREQGWKP